MKVKFAPSLVAVGILFAALTPAVRAETRTYTSKDGKEIEAEVIGVRDGKASLKMASGKTFEVPLERLSEADQTFLTDWGAKNVTYKLTDMSLKVSKNRKTERTEGDKKKKGAKTSNISWEGSLQNNTRGTIDEITIDYTIYRRDFYRSDNGSSEELAEVEGVDDVGSIEAGAIYEFESDVVEEYTKITKGAKGERDTTDRQLVLGAVFKVSIKGRELITYEDPRGIMAKVADEREREKEKEEREAERDR